MHAELISAVYISQCATPGHESETNEEDAHPAKNANLLNLPSSTVVPNRGAAAPWGAIYSAQGCRGLTRFFTISLKIHFQTVIKPQSKLLWVP